MLTSIACTICDSHDTEILHEMENLDFITASLLPLKSIAICRRCGNVYQSPCLSQEDIARLYTKYPDKVHEEGQLSYVTQKENQWRGKVLKKIALPTPIKGKLLEIGCSEGSFVFEALKQGWNCAAIEPSQANLTKAYAKVNSKQIKFHKGFFDDFTENETFDLITHFYVLEHSYSPKQFLLKARRLIQPKGLMLFEIPDLSIFHKLPLAIGLFPYQHITHFYPQSVKRLLLETGWQPIRISGADTVRPSKSYGMQVMAKPATPRPQSANYYSTGKQLLKCYLAARNKNISAIQRKVSPIIKRSINTQKPVVIFGAGAHGRFLVESTKIGQSAGLLFCDSDPIKQGKTVCGLPVMPPRKLLNMDFCAILLASLDYQEDMARALKGLRVPDKKIIRVYGYSLT